MLLFKKFFKFKISLKLKLLRRQGLQFGRQSRIMGGVHFGSEPYLIKVGDHVTISFDVTFITHDGGTWVYRDSDDKKYTKYAPIVVGNNCFIGARAIILPGVKLGNDCIVAAGSVVTKSFPANSVIGGVPAKILMPTQQFIAKCIASKQLCPSGEQRKKWLLNNFKHELELDD